MTDTPQPPGSEEDETHEAQKAQTQEAPRGLTWTPERVETLSRLWKQGHTARRIAEELGCQITRNAVIGKAHRIGLSSKVKTVVKRTGSPPPTTPCPQRCQWPLGNPDHDDFHFCGEPTISQKPYCLTHCRMAYRQVQEEVA